MIIPPLEKGCPWYEISQMAPPNVKWCEASQCSIIVEPANTWSNLAFIVAGIAMWMWANRENSKTMKLFGPAAIIVGVTSLVYHASYNFITQVGDFIGMFLFAGLLVTLNLRRLKIISFQHQVKFYVGQVAVFTGLVFVFYTLNLPYQALVVLQILVIVGAEVALMSKPNEALIPLSVYAPSYGSMQRKPNYKFFLLGILSMGIAAAFSAADVTRTFCDPHNHIIQGHAIWHLLAATSLFFCFLYFRQFDLDQED